MAQAHRRDKPRRGEKNVNKLGVLLMAQPAARGDGQPLPNNARSRLDQMAAKGMSETIAAALHLISENAADVVMI